MKNLDNSPEKPAPPLEQWAELFSPAALALQKLHKRLRRHRNAGHATAVEVAAVGAAIAAVRRLFYNRGIVPPDIDHRDRS